MITDRERHVMTHATAWPKRYRNHFCAGEGHHDWDTLQGLCKVGLMSDRGVSALSGGDHVFTVTPAGLEALEREACE